MSCLFKLAKNLFFLFLLFSGSFAFSKAATLLSLGSGSAAPGGSVALNLSLSSSTAPTGLQWRISYSSDVAAVNVTAGSALASAGKTVTCSAGSGSITCLAYSMDTNIIGNGVVAVVTVTLAASPGSSSIPLGLSNLVGVTGDGSAQIVTGTAGTITVQA